MSYQPKAIWTVVYETGDPEREEVTRRTAKTMAFSRKQAVCNVWYRVGRPQSFYLVEARKEAQPA